MSLNQGHDHGLNYLENKESQSNYKFVLLHGYGASMYDLAELGIYLAKDTMQPAFLFPNGPLQVPIGPGMSGYGWFPIQPEVFEAGFDVKSRLFPVPEEPAGLQEAALALKSLIEEYPGEKLILGGFSQGAMLAAHLTFTGLLRPEILFLFSCAFLLEEQWKASDQKEKPVIFQSHGTEDPILLPEQARRLNQFILEQGYNCEWQTFAGGHEIPMHILEQAKSFLNKNINA